MMLRRSLRILVLGIIAMGAPCQEICSANTGSLPSISPAPSDEITVSAAISLKDALDEIAHLYSTEHPNAEVHFNLGGSGTLQRQIEQGAPVDILISASPKGRNPFQRRGCWGRRLAKIGRGIASSSSFQREARVFLVFRT